MKKKNLNKRLSLGKKQISKLGGIKGGALIQSHLTCTVTQDLFTCTWESELYSACHCEPSWHTNCESINIPCRYTEQPGCSPNTNIICDA